MKVCVDRTGNLHLKETCNQNELTLLDHLECREGFDDIDILALKDMAERYKVSDLFSIFIEILCRKFGR